MNEFKLGARVYIRQLDVFGEVVGIRNEKGQETIYDVVCEHPLPEHRWSGKEYQLAWAKQYGR